MASPADAEGRGILFSMEDDGVPVALEDAEVYLLWHHRVSGKRGCEPFAPVADDDGKEWVVYYPGAMQEAAGMVDAQIMVSLPDERTISTRVFGIRVEPVLVGGEQSEDGFTLFVDVIKRYEEGTGCQGRARRTRSRWRGWHRRSWDRIRCADDDLHGRCRR